MVKNTAISIYIYIIILALFMGCASPIIENASLAAPSLQVATPTPVVAAPVLVKTLDFGLSSGNGFNPRAFTIDSQQQRIYIYNNGQAQDGGQSISTFNIQSNSFNSLHRLSSQSDGNVPQIKSIYVDSHRSRLYALTDYDQNLSIIDTNTMALIDTTPNVGAIAIGSEILYATLPDQLVALDPTYMIELISQKLESLAENRLLLLNEAADRLYLLRENPATLETFIASTLTPISSYAPTDEILSAVVSEADGSIYIIERSSTQTLLRQLNSDGQAMQNAQPIRLRDNYSRVPMAIHNQTLYVADAQNEPFHLLAYSLPDLQLKSTAVIAGFPLDMAVNATNGQVYLLYGDNAIMAFDPTTEMTHVIYTAETVSKALADGTSNRLYVLSEQGNLYIRTLDTDEELGHLKIEADTYQSYRQINGHLVLDPLRNRLFIDGDPVLALNTDSLTLQTFPNLSGQITADPTSDRLFLTPPCQCKLEQCNTLILNADTLTGTETLYPPQDPFIAPCITGTQLDADNQVLFAHINNGTPGSNGGHFFDLFDVADQPIPLYRAGDISFGSAAFDTDGGRIFVPRRRMGLLAIHAYEYDQDTASEVKSLTGVAGDLAYNPNTDHLYAIEAHRLLTLDKDLDVLSEITVSEDTLLLDFDPIGQRLYLKNYTDQILVLSTALESNLIMEAQTQHSGRFSAQRLMALARSLAARRVAASSTASPPPTPAPASAIGSCPIQPEHFTELWVAHLDQLGCPITAESHNSLPLAKQRFERGTLIWHSHTSEIYALPNGHLFAQFPNAWDENMPAYSCPEIAPSQTPPTPVRGFGVVWCQNEVVRQQLGNAIGEEQSVIAVWQAFTFGAIFGVYEQDTYLLDYQTGIWEQIAP